MLTPYELADEILSLNHLITQLNHKLFFYSTIQPINLKLYYYILEGIIVGHVEIRRRKQRKYTDKYDKKVYR